MMRFITWSSIRSVAICLALCVGTVAQAQDFDIYADTDASLREALEAYENRRADIDADELARRLSAAIVAAAAAEEGETVVRLYNQHPGLGLTDAARVAVLFYRLHETEDGEESAALRQQLRGISEAPSRPGSYAAPLAAFYLAQDAWLGDDLPMTVELYRKAYDLAQRDLRPDDPSLVIFAGKYAEYLSYLDREKAGKFADETEKLAARILPADHWAWVTSLNAMAQRAHYEGRFEEALDLRKRLIDRVVQQKGDEHPMLFTHLQNMAVALSGVRRSADGERYALMALKAESGQSQQDRAMHRSLIAELIYSQGRAEASVPYFREGLALMEGLDPQDLRWAHLRMRLARSLSVLGEHEEALALTQAAMPDYRSKIPETHPQRRHVETMASYIYLRAGQAGRAFENVRPILQHNEGRLLDAYATGQDRRALASGNNRLFRDTAIFALNAGDMEAGWRAAQLETLGDLAISTASLSYPGDGAGFSAALDAVRSARDAERKLRAELAAGDSPTDALIDAVTTREALERDLAEAYPDFVEYLRPRPLSIEAARALLSPDEAYILSLSHEDRFLTIALTQEGIAWDQAVLPLHTTTPLVERVRSSLDRGVAEGGRDPFDAEAAHELYRRIFTPRVLAAIEGKSHLIFPAAGVLSRIPPSVLITDMAQENADEPGSRAYLLRDYAISITPNLEKRGATPSKAERAFAGIGAPRLAEAPADRAALRGEAFDIADVASMPSLPSALSELASLQSAFPQGEALLLTGDAATETGVRAAPLRDYRVLAFATHGLVSGQIKGLEEPALVLTPGSPLDGPSNDGLLKASEIVDLDLEADWVILSACNTAAGDVRGAATYNGLARAFQLAGARSLLLSHWPVRDDAAASISVATVEGANQGRSRSEALRQAQLALLDDAAIPYGGAPAIWAPFVLVE